MPQLICSDAMLQCAFGSTPAQLVVLPVNRVNTGNQPAATIMDHAPLTNVMPFGMCNSPSNPQVVAAKGPVPCMPVTTSPWTPGSTTVKIGNQPAISSACQLNCAWGGVITVLQAGQQTVIVP
jgi:hypothetical protein